MTTTTEFAGKVALVTGAGRNIGRAIALTLAAGGAKVAVNTRASLENAEAVAQEIRDAGGQAQVYLADVADARAVQAMVDGVINQFGRIDILVLNASVRKEVRFTEMSFEEWRTVLSISLDGSFHCIKACLAWLNDTIAPAAATIIQTLRMATRRSPGASTSEEWHSSCLQERAVSPA